MNLEWKSNARYSQELNKGSVFELKNNNLGISIHHYVGCGDNWFLSCKALGITTHNLFTQDFSEAVEKAKSYIYDKFLELERFAIEFAFEGEENILVRY